jgi:hypothetical protein
VEFCFNAFQVIASSSSSSSSSSSVTTETVQQPSIMTHHVLVVLEEICFNHACSLLLSPTKRSQSVSQSISQSVSHISSSKGKTHVSQTFTTS